MMNDDLLLKITNLSKHFPGVQALANVDFDVKPGEIVGLVGENGAGKSTLIKIISGVIKKDEGEIQFLGKEFDPNSPQEAQHLGISTIYQELAVVNNLTVAQNLLLNREPRIFEHVGIIDFKKLAKDAWDILQDLGISNIDVNKKISELTIALRQMVEIAKSVSRDARLILMDEPTSALSSNEISTLFEVIHKLKAKGVSVVFISHRLDEVIQIADRIIVMRDGRRSGALTVEEASEEKIIRLMVGRGVGIFPKTEARIGTPVLEVRHLSNHGFIRDISFKVHKGEIVGLAGLVGSGRTDVGRMIFGADQIDSGQISIEEREVRIKHPRDAIRYGIGLVPEDRKSQGLVLLMDIKENITLTVLDQIKRIFNIINQQKQNEIANRYVMALSIATPGLAQQVNNLSGGNQQKVVLAKWLSVNPKVMILDEPTRGIDVGAKAEVHALMSSLAMEGMGILMISSEMPEILGMSDRIIVMCQGRITGEFNREEATQEAIMTCATQFKTPNI
jgi:ribose transport system ATP-binding protein